MIRSVKVAQLLVMASVTVLSACGGLQGWAQAAGCAENNDSCSLQCAGGASCSGTCGRSCSASCASGSTCDITVGPSGSVSCASATCHVTCTGSCSVSCTGGSCDLRCVGDTAPRTLTGGGSCP